MSNYDKMDWKCRRCRWVGNHNELVGKYNKRHGMSDNVCPRCECSVFTLIERKEQSNTAQLEIKS